MWLIPLFFIQITLYELQSVVNQEFPSLDLGNRVSRDTTKRIGFGMYSDVYEGTLLSEKIKVAVKVVRYDSHIIIPVLMVGGSFFSFSVMLIAAYQRLLNEVHIWSELEHENIIKLLGVSTTFDYTISMVSPLMTRGNAFDYVQNLKVIPCPLVRCTILSRVSLILVHL